MSVAAAGRIISPSAIPTSWARPPMTPRLPSYGSFALRSIYADRAIFLPVSDNCVMASKSCSSLAIRSSKSLTDETSPADTLNGVQNGVHSLILAVKLLRSCSPRLPLAGANMLSRSSGVMLATSSPTAAIPKPKLSCERSFKSSNISCATLYSLSSAGMTLRFRAFSRVSRCNRPRSVSDPASPWGACG